LNVSFNVRFPKDLRGEVGQKYEVDLEESRGHYIIHSTPLQLTSEFKIHKNKSVLPPIASSKGALGEWVDITKEFAKSGSSGFNPFHAPGGPIPQAKIVPKKKVPAPSEPPAPQVKVEGPAKLGCRKVKFERKS
jgi:hypothetical protein